MPRDLDGSERGKEKQRSAPARRQEAHGPDRGDVTASPRESISNSRTHSRSTETSARGGGGAHSREDGAGTRRSFARPRPQPPEDAVSAESVPDEGAANEPIMDDITRTRGNREPSGTAKTGAQQKRSRLSFSKEDVPPEPKTLSQNAAAARQRADKAEAKLERARENLPKTHSVKIEKTFDEQKKKSKRRLTFEEEVKSKQSHLKGSPVTRPIKSGMQLAALQTHRKIHEAEHENVGVEAGHKSELMAEGGLRTLSRRRKTAPYRKVAKREGKAARLNAKAAYQKTLADNPNSKKGLLSRMAQKQKIRRQYAKAARQAQKTAKRAKQAGGATRAIAGVIQRHPVAFAVILIIALLVILLVSVFSSLGSIATEGTGMILATSYLAADSDIDAAELAYTEWETDLQIEIRNTERTHPGFDEYRYSVDDIGHGPHELMAYLTAVYNEFTFSGIRADLRGIFDQQYKLTYTEEVEIRTRMVTVIDPVTGEESEEEEEYEWHILNVTLTAQSFTDVIYPRLDAEQTQRYSLLTRVKGNRQYVGSPFPFNWLPYVSNGYGWRVHPISGAKDYHKAVDIAVATGTEIISAHDGTVTFAADNGSYGLVVFIEGEDGIETRYAHCSQLLVTRGQSVKMGDVIAKVGSTGNSTGAHLHFEVLKDGQTLNPLYFAITNDDGSSYIPPGSPGGVNIPAYPGAPMDNARFAAMMEEAQKHLGKPYVFGASGPNSFDCSGFVSYVLSHSIYPGFGRTTAQGLYNICTPVSRADAQPGDLIFFTGTYNAGRPVTHIGIYIGNGQMIHAGKPVQYASIDTPYWTSHLYAFGRLP